MTTNVILACPLCGSAERKYHSEPLPNLYSEKMAAITGIDEGTLLAHFHNVACVQCGLIYKKEAYPPDVIQAIFKDVVPDHPKGWDVMSGRFTPDNFFVELAQYESAILAKQIDQVNRYRRSLLSIVDSIYPHDTQADFKAALTTALLEQDFSYIRMQEESIREKINQPMPFKRFSGFSAPELLDYLEEVCGPISQYDELGCPLWGLLSVTKSRGIDSRFIHRHELNYWGENCRRNETNCIDWLHRQHGIPVDNWTQEVKTEKRQLIGFFQYLDHVESPITFLETIFAQYESAAVILDGIDEPVYIQHITGFTTSALNFIAQKFGKTMHQGFSMIEPSGNRLYVFTN